MFSWTKRSKRSFHAENLKRQQKPYIAPGRGWYHIYTFRLGRPEEVSLDWLPDYPGETLALVRLDIRDYASRELDTLALDFAEQIFRAFQERKKEMILRVCYDTEGKGMEREPQRIFVVQRHMQALVCGCHSDRAGRVCGKLGRDAYLPVFAPGSDLPVGADLAGGDAPCADTLGAKAGASAHAGGK